MSGIEDIKKKAKLSMDEMYEEKSAGKTGNQKDGNPDNQPGNQPEIHQRNKLDSHKPSQEENHSAIHKNNHPGNQQTNQSNTQPDNQLPINPPNQETSKMGIQRSGIPSKQAPTPKPNNFKMTFNLTEDIYKAFNDLYAKRMIEGRKTEKSDMICEAIQYLLKMEEEGKS